MRLMDIKQIEGICRDHKVRLLRHKPEIMEKIHDRSFEAYQNSQKKDVFGDAEYLISFVAERSKFAKFVGVWELRGKKQEKDGRWLYKTRECDGFEKLKYRLVIRWGGGARSWVQRLDSKWEKSNKSKWGKCNKVVEEILPENYVKDFPGYYDFTLSYTELRQMVMHPQANREWHRMLSAIAGVYVILDQKSGKLYVGSATGEEGIWGRWLSYGKKADGGNELLAELLEEDSKRKEFLQYSILRVLEPSATKEEVLFQEGLIKQKLGSRKFGLNGN